MKGDQREPECVFVANSCSTTVSVKVSPRLAPTVSSQLFYDSCTHIPYQVYFTGVHALLVPNSTRSVTDHMTSGQTSYGDGPDGGFAELEEPQEPTMGISVFADL